MRYLCIVRNNASKKNQHFLADVITSNELWTSLDVDFDTWDEGEYTFVATCFYGDDLYYDNMTIDFKGDILDSVIHCTDGDVVLRDLNPFVDTLLIGEYKEIAVYDDKQDKNYLYDDEN